MERSARGDNMTLTPEAAAKLVIGKYTIFNVVTLLDIDRWYPHGGTFSFTRYLLDAGIKPCDKCGAYRRGKCEVCERVEVI